EPCLPGPAPPPGLGGAPRGRRHDQGLPGAAGAAGAPLPLAGLARRRPLAGRRRPDRDRVRAALPAARRLAGGMGALSHPTVTRAALLDRLRLHPPRTPRR